MTVTLSNGGGQQGLDLTGSKLGSETGLGKNDRDPGSRREDTAEMVLSAAFSMQLARARATAALNSDDENETAVVAAAPPPPVIYGLEAEADLDPAVRQRDLAGLAQTLVSEIEASDRMRLGSSGPLNLTLALNSTSLGLTEARILVTRGDLTVSFPIPAGVDPALINASLRELAQTLAQRFPNRTIRLRGEDSSRDNPETAEFNPLKEPVGRRT